MDWIQIIKNLKEQKIKEQDFETAASFREIERWLEFNHSIEEIFDNKKSYNEIVQKELRRLERKKKLYKVSKNTDSE